MLPDKPSELMELALRDFEVIEADPRFIINMRSWLRPYADKCFACMAGAVMYNTLKCSIDVNNWPEETSECDKLKAIDFFRTGEILFGLRNLAIPLPDGMPKHKAICNYTFGGTQFKADIRSLIELFKEYNL